MAQDKLKTFKGVFLKECASTRTMILSMKNKYIVRSRISQKKFREILKYFAEDIEATKIANLTGISRISINKIFLNQITQVPQIPSILSGIIKFYKY